MGNIKLRLLATIVVVVLLPFYGSQSFAFRPACNVKSFSLEKLINDVIEVNRENPSDNFNYDLATMYMIASIHESYVICTPFPARKYPGWGTFPDPEKEINKKIIFWDGVVRDKSYLRKALSLGREKGITSDLRLGWIYEKLGDTDKAISLYEKTFKDNHRKLDQVLLCKVKFCSELMATVESLTYLQRIYQKKKNKKKVEEIESLIKEFRGKIVLNPSYML